MTASTEYKDWRGVPINIGDTVIYGAGVGQSIGMVQGIVDGFTKAGRVWIKIQYRAMSYSSSDSKTRVHMGPDRITVVNDLPPTTIKTEKEKAIDATHRQANYHREALTKIANGTYDRRSYSADFDAKQYHEDALTEAVQFLAKNEA